MADETPQSEMILYQTEDGRTRIQCRFENESIWLTQKLMAELFHKDVRTINEHIQNVFAEAELPPDSVIRKFRITAADGKTYDTQHYSLEMILALAADYSPTEPETQLVFKVIQNKLHFATTGKTAPELIAERANAAEPNMGLTSWKGAVVRKGDVTVAKNYLREDEIEELNRIVVMFLDFAEDQAKRRKEIFLNDWQTKLDEFLRFNERRVLPDAGSVSRETAEEKATREFDLFRERRRAAIEAQAEHDTIRELEDTAKQLPKKPTQRKKKRDDPPLDSGE